MTLRYKGIVHTTGSKDSGKTSFNLQVAPLKQIAFFHSDTKYPGVPKEEFGLFIDLKQMEEGRKLFEFRQELVKVIESVPAGKYPVWIFDTWTRQGEAFRNFVIANRYQFREKEAFVMPHDLKVVGSQSWRDAHEYEARIISMLYRKTGEGYLGLVTHTKEDNQGGVKTGKEIPDAGKALNQVANFRVWLIRSGKGLPTVITMKRMTEAGIIDGYYQPVNVLPDRFDCLPEDKSIWDAIDRYRKNPMGNRTPANGEIPNEFELSIIKGTLTAEQKEIWKANMVAEQNRQQSEAFLFDSQEDDILARVKELTQNPDNGLIEITHAINTEFSRDFGWADIQAYMDR